jgi:L-iditol 2-dehydrogenase
MSKHRIKFKEMVSHEITMADLPQVLPKMFKRELAYNKIVVAVNPE